MLNTELATNVTTKLCPIPGCAEPRARGATGRTLDYCAQHGHEAQRLRAAQKVAARKAKRAEKRVTATEHMKKCRTCRQRFPNTADHFAPSGKAFSMICRTCQLANPTSPTTKAQRAAGFIRESHPADRKTPGTHLICVIDHDTDIMMFMEATVTLTCKTHREQSNPMSWQALLDMTKALGYKIVERGTPATTKKAS